MSDSRSMMKGIIYGLVGALVLTLIGAWVVMQANRSREKLPVLGSVPQFEFLAQDSSHFGRQQMIGQLAVVDFIFTRCQTACPIMASKMGPLYNQFANSPVRFVSISVDPEYDTPAILKQYADDHSVTDNRWIFLHAPIEQVRDVMENGFLLPADNLPMGNSTKFALVDESGTIRGYYDSYDDAAMSQLAMDIARLVRAMRGES